MPNPTDPARTLVVDDDPDLLAVLTLALADLGGLTVATADSASAALAACTEAPPDLVILDLHLGDQDGRDLWSQIRAHLAQTAPDRPPCPVIFLSAITEAEAQDLAKGPGCLGVLTKPVSLATLAQSVRALWGMRP